MLMKTVVLIFSILISLLGMLVGQFAYPFMASFWDGSPTLFAAIIGILIVIVLSIIVSVATKDMFYRKSIIIPFIISVVATFFILVVQFRLTEYRHDYCYCYAVNRLKNKFGITIVNSSLRSWYIGVDDYGDNVIVSMGYSIDYDYNYENEDDKYDYIIEWYDESGNYLGRKDFSEYYNTGEDKLRLDSWNEAKYIAEVWANIELYNVIRARG